MPMKILHKLIEDIPDIEVDEVVVGAFSTLVKSGEGCGISSTLKTAGPHGPIERTGPLTDYTRRELASFIYAQNLVHASIGMAAINSGMALHQRNYQKINAKKLVMEKGQGKTVGVIGHFPFLDQLQGLKRLMIFEKHPLEGDHTEADIKKYLPQADVVVITGTTFINHTFEQIINYIRKDAYVMVMGPSTPISPVLFDYGINAICGTQVRDYEILKRCVMEAIPVKYLEGKEFVAWLNDDDQAKAKSGDKETASIKH